MVSNSIKEYIDKNITSDNALELAYEIYILLGKVLYYSPLYAKYKLDNLIPELDRIRIDNPLNLRRRTIFNTEHLCFR